MRTPQSTDLSPNSGSKKTHEMKLEVVQNRNTFRVSSEVLAENTALARQLKEKGIMKTFHGKIAATGVTVLSLLAPTFSIAGPNTTGGGNGINGAAIEQYAIPAEELVGFNEAKRDLLKKLVPCVDTVEMEPILNKLEKKTIYLVPGDFSQLPSDKTGLHFNTDQVAYQNGSEIFFSEEGLESLKRPGARERIFQHELIMSLLRKPEMVGTQKGHELVRTFGNALNKPKVTCDELLEAAGGMPPAIFLKTDEDRAMPSQNHSKYFDISFRQYPNAEIITVPLAMLAGPVLAAEAWHLTVTAGAKRGGVPALQALDRWALNNKGKFFVGSFISTSAAALGVGRVISTAMEKRNDQQRGEFIESLDDRIAASAGSLK